MPPHRSRAGAREQRSVGGLERRDGGQPIEAELAIQEADAEDEAEEPGRLRRRPIRDECSR
jgi:hypothetical protein